MLMRRRIVCRFVAKASRMRTVLMGRSKTSKCPRFGAKSIVGVGIGATSESDSGFRCVEGSCPARWMGARSSISVSTGLGSRVMDSQTCVGQVPPFQYGELRGAQWVQLGRVPRDGMCVARHPSRRGSSLWSRVVRHVSSTALVAKIDP